MNYRFIGKAERAVNINPPLAPIPQARAHQRDHKIKFAFVVGDYPNTERRRREDTARSYASTDVEVGIVPVAARPFDGLTPAEIQATAPLYHEGFPAGGAGGV